MFVHAQDLLIELRISGSLEYAQDRGTNVKLNIDVSFVCAQDL